ncbi:MAG: amino acid adenylation domain-containing protein [Pseudomonadota bacterium]
MEQLLRKLNQYKVKLSLDGERLAVDAPKGVLTSELISEITQAKPRLLALLRAKSEDLTLPTLVPQPALQHESFALTEVQHAYWMGRNDYVELGGIATHFYIELERDGLDFERLNVSLQKVIGRHAMLRTIIEDGLQRVLPTVPPYRIALHDMRGKSIEKQASALHAIRDKMSHKRLPLDRWPLFEFEAARIDDGRLRLYLSFDMLIIDASSIFLFFLDWQRFYEDGSWSPPPFTIAYRDYAQFQTKLSEYPVFQRAKAYWTARLDTLPSAPNLPLAVQPSQIKNTRFIHRQFDVSAPKWQALKDRAQGIGTTPSTLLMTAFSEVLRMWSKEPDFTLNVTMFNRLAIHAEVPKLIGDFTTTNLLAVYAHANESFTDRVKRLQQQLAEDLEHRIYSGMNVLRDRARRRGNQPGVAMPIVFTSLLALDSQQKTSDSMFFFGEPVYGTSQTPQVWLDHQMIEKDGQLLILWDTIDGLFPENMVDDMFTTYAGLLQTLADVETAWTQITPLLPLPGWQQDQRTIANATQSDVPLKTLHGLVAEQAQRWPDSVAVITESLRLSYGELHRHAYRLGSYLRLHGAHRNGLIAVSMEKGWEQIAAVLGVLHAGAAYLPIDPHLPQQRRWQLAQRAEICFVITQTHLRERLHWPDGIFVLCLDDEAVCDADATPLDILQTPDDLAYVLFTSGSTGEPKGVMIEHRNASNTVQDINRRFDVKESDRALALSALHFDLSVYDIFGVLGAGAALVIPAADRLADPVHWAELTHTHRVTLWNSVPQLLQLWTEHLRQHRLSHDALRWVILSGDWIPVKLPEQTRTVCPHAEILASGGPTETAIWCTHYLVGEVSEEWDSIPYGKPLSNQTMHVYNTLLEDRPVWVSGEIHVGGAAPGRGYLNDSDKTNEKFIVHPHTGEHLYKTGDLGRYLPDGNIEFLGREDFQVKINGFRIELGEIESVLRRQPGVAQALVNVAVHASTGQRQLAAYIVSDSSEHTDPDVLRKALTGCLPDYMVPTHFVALAALPLSANGKVEYKALPSPWVAGDAPISHQAPRNADEQRLFDIWKDLLGHQAFGVDDNFFALGADSIGMVQMMGRITTAFGLPDAPQQMLLQRFFTAPTIAGFATALGQLGMRGLGDGVASPREHLAALPNIVADSGKLHEPFPLSDLQGAYLTGQMVDMEYHVEPNYYIESDFDESFDAPRFERALNAMLHRQRANLPVLTADLQLQVPTTLLPIKLTVADLRDLTPDAVHTALLLTRQELSRRVMPLDSWPWLDFQISLYGRKTRLHVNFSNFFFDAFAAMKMGDAMHYYRHPDQPMPELTLNYRDCVLAYKQIEESASGQASQRYWLDRVASLPESPAIPLAANQTARSRSRLQRREMILPERTWTAFKRKANKFGVTATNAVYAAYAEVLAYWSGSRHFLLSSMLTQRLPLHAQMGDIIGNFAAVYPLEIDWRKDAPFYDRARGVQMRLIEDGQHIYWGSARVWQALNRLRKTPGRAVSPFVVVSGLDMPAREQTNFGCLDTPQVLIDQQLWHLADGGFWATWDVNERFFADGVVDAMWGAFRALLVSLAEEESTWSQHSFGLLPTVQHQQRALMNRTAQAVPDSTLHSLLPASATRYAEKPAVIDGRGTMHYAELYRSSNSLAHQLRAAGVKPGQLVAILLDKRCEQIVAAHGIHIAGAAYVPIDPEWPAERIQYLLENTGATIVVTRIGLRPQFPMLLDSQVACLDDPDHTEWPDVALTILRQPQDLAYVIYTSGSTGNPKGVMINHCGALNTVLDINRRFEIGAQDVIFGISALTFDLSVYDLFGSAAAGATLVLPSASASTSPSAWIELIEEHGVTVWNSAPSLMQLLVDAAEAIGVSLPSLKTVMLSGDWIPVKLPQQILRIAPNARVISLGGATEASIWSIYYPVEQHDPTWVSIPYGKALTNQSWHILDAQGNDAPTWTPGALYIGGIGLAMGYWRDEEKTSATFTCHPKTGERLYRTGDLGRYLPDGNIEFLGRIDFQVKIQGFRIELGEIEHALLAHPAVQNVTLIARGERSGRQLVAFVVLRGQGMQPSVASPEIQAFLRGKLPAYMVPAQIIFLDQLPLTPNGKVDRSALNALTPNPKTGRQVLLAPRNATEADLVNIWEEVLAISPIGVEDDFFELGGQSLAAIQVMTRIEQKFGERLPLAALFEGATVSRLAEKLGSTNAAWTPLVTIRAPKKGLSEGMACFFVHPAGGNVLCYQGLAEKMARPFYGLEAAGLSGAQLPLDDMEQMAALYLQAIRKAQPHGPYLLGGWSSGGMVAFELARQLEHHGETVAQILMLDTPAPMPQEAVDPGILLHWFLEDINFGFDARSMPLEGLANDGDLGRALEQITQRYGLAIAIDVTQLNMIYAVFKGVLNACRRYCPTQIRADIALLRANEGLVGEFANYPAAELADWGWKALTHGQVTTVLVPGTHYTILTPPNLDALRQEIERLLFPASERQETFVN